MLVQVEALQMLVQGRCIMPDLPASAWLQNCKRLCGPAYTGMHADVGITVRHCTPDGAITTRQSNKDRLARCASVLHRPHSQQPVTPVLGLKG